MGILYLTVLLFFTACSPASTTVGLQQQSYTVSEEKVYNICLPDLQPPAPYAGDACLLGADFQKDSLTGGDADHFTALAGEQQVYSKTLSPEEEAPLLWVLECYTKGVLPVVTLGEDFAPADLEEVAQKLGAYHIPLLVEYLPDPLSGSLNPEQYRTRYLQARKIFHEFAPNAAFLWTVDDGDVLSAMEYYPQDSLVDWVGLQLYLTPEKQSPDGFEVFHTAFREKKPILVRLGVSHFNLSTGTYDLAFAEESLTRAYTALRSASGVRAVVYMSENNSFYGSGNIRGYNFSLTGERSLLAVWKNICAETAGAEGWHKTGQQAYDLGGVFYVPHEAGELYINGTLCTRCTETFRVEEKNKNFLLFSGTF